MQKIKNTKGLKDAREKKREPYFNEEKCGIVLNAENIINETRLSL